MQMNQDCLSRQPYLNLLKSIIEKQKDNYSGYSFAIDGDWGSGKTWILNTLENILLNEKDNEYLIFHYNAWENDFYEEPLVALLSVMIEKLNEVTSQKSLYDAAVDELLQQVSADLLTLVSGIVKEVTKIGVDQIIERKKGFFKRIKQSRKISANGTNTLIPLHETLKIVRENILKMSGKVHIILVVDETFLISFITSVLSGLNRRLQEKIFKQVELCHKLTLQIKPDFDTEHITYVFLIYEILSCICQFVFHLNKTKIENFLISLTK